MPEKEKNTGISRRDFLKDAGLIVGGATVGSMAFLSACSKTTTVTSTITGPPVTTTLSQFVDPIDASVWPTLAALQTHFAAAHPGLALSDDVVTLNVNGTDYNLWVNPIWPLSYVLREKLGFFGVKVGCDVGQCGSCTILVDGVPMFACLMLAIDSGGHKLVTVEGLSDDGVTLNPLQQKGHGISFKSKTLEEPLRLVRIVHERLPCDSHERSLRLITAFLNFVRSMLQSGESGIFKRCGSWNRWNYRTSWMVRDKSTLVWTAKDNSPRNNPLR